MSSPTPAAWGRPAAPLALAYLAGPVLDWTMVGLSLFMINGGYLDGWAHIHQLTVIQTEGFFTPYHGLIYSGAVGLLLVLAGVAGARRRWGLSTLPPHYGWTAAGLGLFALAAVGDLLWHTLFGIENDIEAVVSPTHLALLGSGFVILQGPIRAAAARPLPPGPRATWRSHGMIPVAAGLLFNATLLFGEAFHPWARTLAAGNMRPAQPSPAIGWAAEEGLGMAALLFFSGLVVGGILLITRRQPRWLPPGSLVLILLGNLVPTVLIHDVYLAPGPGPLLLGAVLLAGAVEGLYRLLRPTLARRPAWTAWAVLTPMILTGGYLLILALTDSHLWWGWHINSGIVGQAGLLGGGLSVALAPRQEGSSDVA